MVNPLKSDCLFSPLAYTFPFKLVTRFGVRSREQPLPDNLEYSHYLFVV